MSQNKAALLAVVAELNEKRQAGIKKPASMSIEELIGAINEETNYGDDLTKLSKVSRATISALLENSHSDDSGGDDAGEDDGSDAAGDDSGADPENDFSSREAMNLAAQDMNEVMGLKPLLDTTLDDQKFMKAFKKTAAMAEGTDNFSEHTWKVFEALDIGPERIRMIPEKASKEEKKPAKMSLHPDDGVKTPAKKKPAEKAAPAEKAPKAAAKPEKKEPAPKTEKQPPAPKAPKGPGVIATICEFLDKAAAGKKTFTRDDIHAQLVKAFPEREASSLMSTVKTKVPGDLSKEKGYIFEKLADGKFKVQLPKK